LVAGGLFVVLIVLAPFYGFDRDELYFLDCARHLQAAYVDQPVLTPLIVRISLELFGVSLTGLRLWPALAGAGTVLIGAMTARELGGGMRAQIGAALGTATMPSLLAVDHLIGPTAFDLLAWASLALVWLRIERTGKPGGGWRQAASSAWAWRTSTASASLRSPSLRAPW
jgi:4-amino-4-deoxy-L-arabinose transferase-like glycosyltransferase